MKTFLVLRGSEIDSKRREGRKEGRKERRGSRNHLHSDTQRCSCSSVAGKVEQEEAAAQRWRNRQVQRSERREKEEKEEMER